MQEGEYVRRLEIRKRQIDHATRLVTKKVHKAREEYRISRLSYLEQKGLFRKIEKRLGLMKSACHTSADRAETLRAGELQLLHRRYRSVMGQLRETGKRLTEFGQALSRRKNILNGKQSELEVLRARERAVSAAVKAKSVQLWSSAESDTLEESTYCKLFTGNRLSSKCADVLDDGCSLFELFRSGEEEQCPRFAVPVEEVSFGQVWSADAGQPSDDASRQQGSHNSDPAGGEGGGVRPSLWGEGMSALEGYPSIEGKVRDGAAATGDKSFTSALVSTIARWSAWQSTGSDGRFDLQFSDQFGEEFRFQINREPDGRLAIAIVAQNPRSAYHLREAREEISQELRYAGYRVGNITIQKKAREDEAQREA